MTAERARETGTDDAYTNHDLRAERGTAQKSTVQFAFAFRELFDEFQSADVAAATGRDLNRWVGVGGIFLVLVALGWASVAPLLEWLPEDKRHTLGIVAALIGVVGTACGLVAMWHGALRQRWLEMRLKTETLRLFHFRYIAAHVDEIIAAAHDQQLQGAYESTRRGALKHLTDGALANTRKALDEAIEVDHPDPLQWVIEQPVNSTVGENDVFDAWRELRLEWQLGYCEAKLGERRTVGVRSPMRRERLFTLIGWVCLVAVVVLHLVHLVTVVPFLDTVIVGVALIALAARALEDGLKPQREVERYEQYRANIRVALSEFANATTAEEKARVMRHFERVSTEEMRTFLRTHSKAKYLL